MLEMPVIDFLREAADRKPVPGGGAIAALAGALGCTMAHMSAAYSTGDKFAQAKEQIDEMMKQFAEAMGKFAELVEADAAAYSKYDAAMKMPRSTEAEKMVRKTAMQFAIQNAVKAPLDVCVLSTQTLQALAPLVEIGNANLISDVGVAALMLRSAFYCGRLNVEINLTTMGEREGKEELVQNLDHLEKAVNELTQYIYDTAMEVIRQK